MYVNKLELTVDQYGDKIYKIPDEHKFPFANYGQLNMNILLLVMPLRMQ